MNNTQAKKPNGSTKKKLKIRKMSANIGILKIKKEDL